MSTTTSECGFYSIFFLTLACDCLEIRFSHSSSPPITSLHISRFHSAGGREGRRILRITCMLIIGGRASLADWSEHEMRKERASFSIQPPSLGIEDTFVLLNPPLSSYLWNLLGETHILKLTIFLHIFGERCWISRLRLFFFTFSTVLRHTNCSFVKCLPFTPQQFSY